MNTTEIATKALELTVDYFASNYRIENIDAAAPVIAKFFADSCDDIVRAMFLKIGA